MNDVMNHTTYFVHYHTKLMHIKISIIVFADVIILDPDDCQVTLTQLFVVDGYDSTLILVVG